MIYTFEIAIVVFAYLVVIIGGYLIRLMLRRYEKEVETSGLRGAGMVIGIVERIMVLTFVAPSTDYHSAIFCNSSFELIPNETTIPTKSTCRQTNFLTERFV